MLYMEKTKINRFVSDIFDVGSTVDIFYNRVNECCRVGGRMENDT